MAEVEEVAGKEISKEHVSRRVEDWIKRINELYDQIEIWLPDGWKAERKRSVFMEEEMMLKSAVSGRRLPILDLISSSGSRASVEPRGLWIIGANGRADLFAGDKQFVLVDAADAFLPSKWKIADFSARNKSELLNEATLVAALVQ